MWYGLFRLLCSICRCLLKCKNVLPAPGPTSRFCAVYSATGVLFTMWVGIMISKQSFYIKGIEDPVTYKNSAFGAMGAFIFTFLASVAYLIYEACCLGGGAAGQIGPPNSRTYERVSTGGSGGVSPGLGGLPPGMTDYEVNMELANSSASSSPLESSSYHSTGSETRRRKKSPSASRETLGGELI